MQLDLKEPVGEGVHWIHLAEDTVPWFACMNTLMIFAFHKTLTALPLSEQLLCCHELLLCFMEFVACLISSRVVYKVGGTAGPHQNSHSLFRSPLDPWQHFSDWTVRQTKWHWVKFLSWYFGFTLPVLIPPLFHIHLLLLRYDGLSCGRSVRHSGSSTLKAKKKVLSWWQQQNGLLLQTEYPVARLNSLQDAAESLVVAVRSKGY
jgi:hypothetical protein